MTGGLNSILESKKGFDSQPRVSKTTDAGGCNEPSASGTHAVFCRCSMKAGAKSQDFHGRSSTPGRCR